MREALMVHVWERLHDRALIAADLLHRPPRPGA